MEGKAENMSQKERLPPGWKVYVSKNYPHRPYYFNHKTGDTMWEYPVLSPTEKSKSHTSSRSSVSNSPSRKRSSHVSKYPHSPTEKKTSMQKRKQELSPSISQKKSQKPEKISFKLHSARSPVKPPSPSIKSSDQVKLSEKRRSAPTTQDAASVKKVTYGTKTAVVDPIVRKSSTLSLSDTDERAEKGSVFSRLDARKLLRNISRLESLKKYKKRRFRSEVEHYSSDDNTCKIKSKQDEIQSSSCSRSSNQRKSPTTSSPKPFRHSAGEHSRPSDEVRHVSPLCNKAVAFKSSVNLQTGRSIEVCETEDVEMLDISQQGPNLDDNIEPMKIDECLGNFETLMFTHIVLDTNFLLEHLEYIDELKDKSFDGCGPPVIFIPWVVVQELDKIKQKRSDVLSGKASEAIRYMYDIFLSKHPRFRGQSSKMAFKDDPGYQSDCNDDKILQCCEQLFEVLPKEKVILLTEDKNLINKAVINNIRAYTKKSFQKHIAKSPSVKALPAAALIEKEPDTELAMKVFLDGISCAVKTLLKELLEKVVTCEFKNVYGEIWTKIIAVTPPWTLTNLLFCMNKHWIAVFNFVFSNDMKTHCEKLHKMLKKSKGFISEKCDVLNMFACAEGICQEVMKKRDSIARPVISEINKMKLVCELQFQKNSSNQTKNSPSLKQSSSSEGTAFLVFQYVWKVIDHFTSLVLDSCDIQPGISSAKPNCSDIVAFLPRFYRCVGELLSCMEQVVKDVSNDGHIKEFHGCLVNFVPSLKTDMSPPETENFTAENLAAFCRNGEKRELLENGFAQLRNFFESLDCCIARNGSLIIKGANDIL